ncbi:Ca2+-binding RTX toxin-like protein [Bradyrhizobium sp. I1.7.5]
MAGGDGDDVYYVDSALDRAVEALGAGSDAVIASVSFTVETGSEIELLTTNDAAATAINLTGNEFGQSLIGNAGAIRSMARVVPTPCRG